jgi:hypothetical protein
MGGYSSGERASITERLWLGTILLAVYGCLSVLWLSSRAWRPWINDYRLSALFQGSLQSPGALRRKPMQTPTQWL